MPTPVFLTVDTELIWRHHVDGRDLADIYDRSFEPAGVGVGYQLARLREHELKATFFVDPMPALVYGLDPIKRVVAAILAAGQEVQLHLHANWTGASREHREAYARFNLAEYDPAQQQALIVGARDLLIAAGAPRPIAFRAGNYAANANTLDALAALGFDYDSSHNGSMKPALSMIDLPCEQIAPIVHRGLIEVPVSLIEERPGKLRTFQICALSVAEMAAALDHAVTAGHALVTIVSHGFELANRTGTRPNAVHVRRFDALCALLDARREALPTQHFADRPPLALDRSDTPLGPSAYRLYRRQAEQLWSNLIAERAA